MDLKQNEQIEKWAQDAASGKKHYTYHDTPISETDGARATDPFRAAGRVRDGWWGKVKPETLRKLGRNFAVDVAYCATPISENLAESPEGFLICRGCSIGRSGFQTYLVSEVADPEGLLEGFDPSEEIDLWRDPSEVFSKSALASFEGKTLTLTHPDELLNPDNEREHHAGHIQNIRPGEDPLDSGDWPLLADLIVKDRAAIDAIRDGQCELSCGYTYKLVREGKRFDQRDILGNHVALVTKGRAGSEVRVDTSGLRSDTEDDMNLENRMYAGSNSRRRSE